MHRTWTCPRCSAHNMNAPEPCFACGWPNHGCKYKIKYDLQEYICQVKCDAMTSLNSVSMVHVPNMREELVQLLVACPDTTNANCEFKKIADARAEKTKEEYS